MNAHARFPEAAETAESRRRVRRKRPVLSRGAALPVLHLGLLVVAGAAVAAQFEAGRLEEALRLAPEETPHVEPALSPGWLWAYLGGAPVLFAVHRTLFWRGARRRLRAAHLVLTAIWGVAILVTATAFLLS